MIAIEPHIASLAHVPDQDPDPEAMLSSYLKYGRMLKEMVAKIQSGEN